MEPHLINSAEAAKLLGLQPQTIRLWRSKGLGPRYVRLHGSRGRVLYDLADLNRWLDGRKNTVTAKESSDA